MMIAKNCLYRLRPGTRSIFGALNIIFNRVSESRIEAVGPDRACAEWLMRNGAFIRWQGQPKFVEHYDNLPLDDKDRTSYFLEEINATDASISHHGFPHFKGCQYIYTVKFKNCWYIDDSCLAQLNYIAHTLCYLEISNCAEVTDKGLQELTILKHLRELQLGKLQNVNDLPKSILDLKKALPSCNIEII